VFKNNVPLPNGGVGIAFAASCFKINDMLLSSYKYYSYLLFVAA
jgi:hypothetical protein